MTLLDTNVLIDLVTAGSPHLVEIQQWMAEKEELCTTAVAWSEFCNGNHTREQKDAIFAVIGGRVLDFTQQQAEAASLLFHRTGRRRGSHADCMIAAAGMANRCPIATRNVRDFMRFVPYGVSVRTIETRG